MRVEDVPREGERFGGGWGFGGDEEGTWRVRGGWRPTREMEEEVLALMMRRGKEGFRAEREGDAEGQDGDIMKDEMDGETTDDQGRRHHHRDGSTPSPPRTESTLQPVVLADDEAAAEILQPMINHTLSQLDDLLTALHKGRAVRRKYTPRGSRSPR